MSLSFGFSLMSPLLSAGEENIPISKKFLLNWVLKEETVKNQKNEYNLDNYITLRSNGQLNYLGAKSYF